MQNRWSRNSGASEASGRKPNNRMPVPAAHRLLDIRRLLDTADARWAITSPLFGQHRRQRVPASAISRRALARALREVITGGCLATFTRLTSTRPARDAASGTRLTA